jgi:hypothetical protein
MDELGFYDAPRDIETIWRGLEAVARPPYTQSWGWIENWLAAHDTPPPLAVIHDRAGVPIAAAFDDQPVLRAPAFPELGAVRETYRVAVDREVVQPHVDLEAVCGVDGGYASMLPAAIRAHLAHDRAQHGELVVETASDGPRAHVIFDELLALQGAPDDKFYRRLIDQRAPAGEIQLVRVRADDVTLGCLFNVAWHDHVVTLLAAFAAARDADICHAAAVEHAAARGFAIYELRTADARLATGETRRVVLRLDHRVQHKLAG